MLVSALALLTAACDAVGSAGGSTTTTTNSTTTTTNSTTTSMPTTTASTTTSTSTTTTSSTTSTTSTTVAAPTGAPVVNVGDASVVEPDSGSVIAKVPVDLSTTASTSVVVGYSVAADTAGAGDFQPATGKLTFTAGQANKQISVTINGDTNPENNEHVSVHITSVTPNAVSGDSGGVTILDNDAGGPPTQVEANLGNVVAVEADNGTHTAELPVTLNEPAPGPESFTYGIDCDTATAGNDFSQAASGTINFTVGQQSKSIVIHVDPDTIREGTEAIGESLQPANDLATVDRQYGTAEIVDNDPSVVGGVDNESVAPDGSLGTYPDDSFTTPCETILARAGASSISGDGQFVAFESTATNLVAGDTNGLSDLFVRNQATGLTERVSVKSDGSQVTTADLPGGVGVAGYDPVLSSDGRYVVFDSYARLVPSDTDDGADVYLYDLQTSTLELISVAIGGGGSGMTGTPPGESYALGADVSADGRYVAFESSSPSLVTGDTDPPADSIRPDGYWPDIFLRDRVAGTTTLVSTVGDTGDLSPVMTPDASKIAYVGPVTVGGAASQGIYVYDVATATTQLVSLSSSGHAVEAIEPAISADGTKVAFRAFGTVVAGLSNPDVGHIYLRDLSAGTTVLVDTATAGITADREPNSPTVSADGRYVSFDCWCQRMDNGANPGMNHEGVYQRDLTLGTTQEVDVNQSGTVADQDSSVAGHTHYMSDDGTLVVFGSMGANLVPDDTNVHADVFVKRLG